MMPSIPSVTISLPLCSGLTKFGVTPGGGGIAPINAMMDRVPQKRK